MMLMMLSHYMTTACKSIVLEKLINFYYAPNHNNKIPIAIFTIEDKFDNDDISRIETMKNNFTMISNNTNYLITNEDNDTNESIN